MNAYTPTGQIKEVHWAESSPPKHPHFEQEGKIRKIVANIKSEIEGYLIQGAEKYFTGQTGKIYDFRDPVIRRCWLLAIKAQKYGVVYFLSRSDAEVTGKHFLKKHRQVIEEIGRVLAVNNNANRLFNYAVYRYVRSDRRKRLFSKQLVPVNAISSIGADNICVREEDFGSPDAERMLQVEKPLYDLHDFTHQTCATLCTTIYGNRYFEFLAHLPKRLKRLISSENLRTTKAIPLSDGLVFSELLLGLYDNLNCGALSSDQAVAAMAEEVASYFLDGKALLHPTTKTLMAAEPVTVEQLATLVQNKFYELPASEIEQKMFTRGGNDSRDELQGLTAFQRIEFLARLGDRWMYFERRNTLRHRAQIETYQRVATRMLAASTDEEGRKLLAFIISKISYEAYMKDNDTNLWHILHDRAALQPERPSTTRRHRKNRFNHG